ncbi:hypothetical protein GSI_03639 [Ganoderma sinense ZZ0214-1]|uniref:Uncharacterized protein n=1 Tax=Ganoderma sinense ZZ0214-1 TaxID=1077348 RepID=A0A2G8SJI4_9APHY|nr:hypothetical protein GSI_03639 [Ganoderma sinense ZZ0214-1]
MPSNNTPSAEISAAPYPPSPQEACCFYYALPSQPRLIARSSTYVWVEPTGMEAYNTPKESSPFNASHPLRAIWESTVGPTMVAYLDAKGVKWTSLDPLRMGKIGDTSPPHIVWLGVVPGSLSPEEGVEVATHCRNILSSHGIDDVHVEIRESEVLRSSAGREPKPMFKPDARTSDPVASAREPLSTSLGLPICAEDTPSVGGIGGFFISDARKPGRLFLVTARHVLFPPDTDANELFRRSDHALDVPRKNVLLCGDTAMEKYLELIRLELSRRQSVIERMEGWLATLATDPLVTNVETARKNAQNRLQEAQDAVVDLGALLVDIATHWSKRENRVLGHVVLSPPIRVPGEDGSGSGSGFAEDWAVVEVDAAMVNAANFVGNAIDLALPTAVPIYEFMARMCPKPWPPSRPSPFCYPLDRLLEFSGTIPDEELWGFSPHTQTPDHYHHELEDDDDKNDNDNGGGGDRCIMVLKRSLVSGLTIGRLNPILSFTRVFLPSPPSASQPERESEPSGHWQTSKAVTVLPRSSAWPREEPFAQPGDSGAAVVDGRGRLAGMIVAGASGGNYSDQFDCVYLASGDFLRRRMAEYGIEADLAPSL